MSRPDYKPETAGGQMWQRMADECEARRADWLERLPVLYAERDAAEAGWVACGPVAMWNAREAVSAAEKHISKLTKDRNDYQRMAWVCG